MSNYMNVPAETAEIPGAGCLFAVPHGFTHMRVDNTVILFRPASAVDIKYEYDTGGSVHGAFTISVTETCGTGDIETTARLLYRKYTRLNCEADLCMDGAIADSLYFRWTDGIHNLTTWLFRAHGTGHQVVEVTHAWWFWIQNEPSTDAISSIVAEIARSTHRSDGVREV